MVSVDMRLVWLALGGFASGTEGFLIGSLLPGIGDSMGVGIGQAGLIAFAYSLASGFGAPAIAVIFGDADRKSIMAAAALAFAVGALMVGLAPNFEWAVAGRIVLGAASGLYGAMSQATAVALAPAERRARAIAVVVSGVSAAVVVGAPLGAWISGMYGWRIVYLIIAGLAFVTAVTVWLVLPRGIRGERQTIRERLGVLSVPGLPRALLATGLLMMSGFPILTYIAPITTDLIGLAASAMPLVLLANGLGALTGNWLGGQMADRVGVQRTILISTVGQVVVLLALAGVAALPQPIVGLAYYLYVFVFGMVGWTFYVAQVSRVGTLAGSRAPLALTLFGTAVSLGIAVAAVVGGAVIERLGIGAMSVVAVFAIASLAVTSWRAAKPAAEAEAA